MWTIVASMMGVLLTIYVVIVVEQVCYFRDTVALIGVIERKHVDGAQRAR